MTHASGALAAGLLSFCNNQTVTKYFRVGIPIKISDVCGLAREAGAAIMAVYQGEHEVELKADDSPLTAADRAAHAVIVEGLRALAPQIPVLSEEDCAISFEERCDWSRYWLVDPLDGTKEFIKRNGEFTVNIALVEDGQPVLGVVFAPALDVLYFAQRGAGAFRQEGAGEAVAIHVRPHRAGEPWRVVASRSHLGEEVGRFLECLGEHELVSMGSSLKLCLVAEGRAHLYPRLGPTSEWDTAAAHCVVDEAGGRVLDTDLQPLAYNTKDSLLNPYFMVSTDTDERWTTCLQNTRM